MQSYNKEKDNCVISSALARVICAQRNRSVFIPLQLHTSLGFFLFFLSNTLGPQIKSTVLLIHFYQLCAIYPCRVNQPTPHPHPHTKENPWTTGNQILFQHLLFVTKLHKTNLKRNNGL